MLLFRRYWIAKLLKFVQLGTWSTLKCWNSLRALFTAAKSLAFTAPCRTIKHSPHLWTGWLPFLQLCFNESLRQNWYLTSPSTYTIEREKQKATTTLIFWTEKQNVRAYFTNPPPKQNPQLSLLLVKIWFSFLHQHQTKRLQRQKTIHVLLPRHPPHYAQVDFVSSGVIFLDPKHRIQHFGGSLRYC